MAEKSQEACCSDQFCTCKEKPGLPCGKEGNGLEVAVELVSDPEDNSTKASNNLGKDKCSTPEQVCCKCGKPIQDSPEAVEVTVTVESSEPAGCGLEDCDTEFCTAQDLPCENMEEPAINDDDNTAEVSDTPEEKRPSEGGESAIEDDPAADASEETPPDETEATESPEPEEGSERKSESSNPVPTEDANAETEAEPTELPTGAKKPCCCKTKKDPPPE